MKNIFCALLLNFLFNCISAQNLLSPELLLEMKRLSEPALSPDGKTILYVVETMSFNENKGFKDIYSVSVAGGNPVQLSAQRSNEFSPQWSADGKRICYLSNETGSVQAFEMFADGSNKRQITKVESGISSFSISESDSLVAFVADVKTTSDIHDRYTDVPKANAKISDDLFYRTWNQWDDYASAHIFIYKRVNIEMDGNAALDILSGEAFDAESYSMSPDAKFIAYSSKKLNGKEFAKSTNTDIYLYNVASKTTLNISQGLPGYDLNPKFSKDGKKICWTSMPTNGNEADITSLLYYDVTLKKVESYILNLGESIENFVWSNDAKCIYFLMEREGTIQLYTLDCASKKVKQITNGQQDYSSLTVFGNDAVALKTTFSLPDEVVKINLKTGVETQLTFTNKKILDKLKFGKCTTNWIKTNDTKKVHTWVFYPPDFDSTKKYPTILYLQGGPQVGISQAFSYRWNFQLMCSKGYIVVAPNRRGVPGFGKEWKDAITKDWGGQSIEDYLCAIDSIAKRPYIDTLRIAAVGASYGAYSVYWLEGHNAKHRFKTFIAHCGVFNFESWYPMTDQTFFGTHELGGSYWENAQPKSYTQFSPHHFVKNWDTPILVIHNEQDFRVPVSEGMQAFGAAQLKNIKSRFLYFPDEGHWVLKPQNSLVWHREFYRWLDETLK